MERIKRTRKECWEFTVDGLPLLTPDADVEISVNDLDSDDSGRDESGFLHRSRIREGVMTWGFSYATLSYGDYRYLESLFAGKATFTFRHRDPSPLGTEKKCIAYRSKHAITLHDQKRGIYKNYRFNIIEC